MGARILATGAALAAAAVPLALAPAALGASAGAACTPERLATLKAGTLTVGTDNPAFPPWFAGGEKKGSVWKFNDPTNRKGYESAVAYAVARRLGYAPANVAWTVVPFARSYAPGKKPFDVFINQVSYLPERARNVTFSPSYYNVNQAVVALKNRPIARVRTIAGLRGYRLGVPVGTTSFQVVKDRIRPTQEPRAYDTQNDAVNALKAGVVDGLVVDYPTAFFITGAQVENAKVLGQIPSPKGNQEYFGLVMAKDSPIAPCVSRAVRALRSNGTLARLERTWLAQATGAPVLK